MRTIILTATALLSVAAPAAAVALSAAPASAAVGSGRNCVSVAEYRQIHRGMTQRRVERLAHATPVQRHPRGLRWYEACHRSAWVAVDYSATHRVQMRYRIGHD